MKATRGPRSSKFTRADIPIMSAAFPRNIIVIPASPGARPSIKEEARLMLPGRRSWAILIHTGCTDIRKKPATINSAIERRPSVLNEKKNSGIDNARLACIIRNPFLVRS